MKMKVLLVDTAGLRDSTNDPIERIGVSKTKAKLQQSEIIILVIDSSTFDSSSINDNIESIVKHTIDVDSISDEARIIVVFNKADLNSIQLPQSKALFPLFCFSFDSFFLSIQFDLEFQFSFGNQTFPGLVCSISCTTGKNWDVFLDSLSQVCVDLCGETGQGSSLCSSLRHYEHLLTCRESMTKFHDGISIGDASIMCEYLRLAVKELGNLTGDHITKDEIIDTIFSNFCIGK